MSLEKIQLCPYPFSLETEQERDSAREKDFLDINKKIFAQQNVISAKARVTFAENTFQGPYSKISSEAITVTVPKKSSTTSNRPRLVRTESTTLLPQADAGITPNTHRLYIKTLEQWNSIENLNYFQNEPATAIIIDLRCIRTLEEWNSIKNIDFLIQNLVKQFKTRGYKDLTVTLTINSLRLAALFELYGFRCKSQDKNHSVFSQTFSDSTCHPDEEPSSTLPVEFQPVKFKYRELF